MNARAWVSDGARGALVTADGTVDWYGPMRADEAPWLWRILDPAGGAVRVGPVRSDPAAARRLPPYQLQYRPGTNVVELVTGDARGRVRLLDALPWPGPNDTPPGRLVRVVTALSGPVDVEIEVIPSGRFGPAREVSAWTEGVVVDGLAVRAGLELLAEPLDRDRPRWRGVRRLDEGESLVVTVDDDPRLPALSLDAAMDLLARTEDAWRRWGWTALAQGPYAAAVERSLLVLRSLTGNGVGAPVAGGATSLPRRAGGERTSDARLVRWADAASAASALSGVGLAEDAEAAEAWLRRAAEATELPWPAALAPDCSSLPEREELGLQGWRRSQPVVSGKDLPGAPGTVDADLYGDVVAAVRRSGPATPLFGAAPQGRSGPGTPLFGAAPQGRSGTGTPLFGAAPQGRSGPLAAAWPALAAAADWVADHWQRPDRGVWGLAQPVSGPPSRLVASALQAWFVLDRMTRLARAANPLDLQAAVWQQTAAEVMAWVEQEGMAAGGGLRRTGTGSDTGTSQDADAALLRVAWRGPWPASHPVVEATVDRVLEQLGSGPLVYRYGEQVDDGRGGLDSPDLTASLWAVRALARLQRWDEAHERMEAVVSLGGTLGVLAEAADPLSSELLGSLPSASAHLALVEAAAELAPGPR